MPSLLPFDGLDDAAPAVLAELRGRLGVEALLVVQEDTGRAGDGEQARRYRVTHAATRRGGYRPGSLLPWPEVAAALADGSAPPVAPAAAAVAAYARALTPDRPRLGAVAGAPIRRRDGSVLGVLLGVDSAPHPPELAASLPLVEVAARLLGTVAGSAPDRRGRGFYPEGERAIGDTVALSFREAGLPLAGDGAAGGAGVHGLATRRGWEQAVRAEEARCRRYGNKAAIVSVDLAPALLHDAPAGDLLGRAAATVAATTRAHDLVAWLGRTELGVLAVECDQTALVTLVRRIQEKLAAGGLRAEVTGLVRPSGGTLEQAWQEIASSNGRTRQSRT